MTDSKSLLLILTLFFFAISSCNMELKNPNDFTITLSPERSITEGHAVIPDLTAARAVILKIRQYTNEIKTYKKEDLTITKNSITVPGGIKSGQGFDIELKLMNTVCTYIARAKDVIIEPYKNSVITLTVEEARPHIILPAKKIVTSSSFKENIFFAVANPEKKDALVFKGSTGGDTNRIFDFGFDKYGRMFTIQKYNSTLGIYSYDKSLFLSSDIRTQAIFFDTKENTIYYVKDKILRKRSVFWTSFGEMISGVTLADSIKEISVGKNYIVAEYSTYISSRNHYYLLCIDKYNINKILKKFEFDTRIAGNVDVMVSGDIVYVTYRATGSSGGSSVKWSKMYVYSLPDFTLLKEVSGFYGALCFLGERDGKIYIADKHSNSAIPKRLGIYDTLTGKLKFIDVKEFSNEIEFEWW